MPPPGSGSRKRRAKIPALPPRREPSCLRFYSHPARAASDRIIRCVKSPPPSSVRAIVLPRPAGAVPHSEIPASFRLSASRLPDSISACLPYAGSSRGRSRHRSASALRVEESCMVASGRRPARITPGVCSWTGRYGRGMRRFNTEAEQESARLETWRRGRLAWGPRTRLRCEATDEYATAAAGQRTS